MKRTITMWGITTGKGTRLLGDISIFVEQLPFLTVTRKTMLLEKEERPVKVKVTLEWEP